LVLACGGETEDKIELTTQERLFNMLPRGTTEFAYVDIEAVWSRSEFQQEVDRRFGRLMIVTGDVITEEMTRSAEITEGIFGFNQKEGRIDHEVGILVGDFRQALGVLDLAVSAGTGGRIEIGKTETYRGISVYGFQSSPAVYVAVPDPETLVLTFSVDRTKEIIDWMQDGGWASRLITGTLQELAQGEFLYSARVEPGTQADSGNPFAAMTRNSFGVSFNDGGTSTVRSLISFAEPEQAGAAFEWMEAQGLTGGLFFGGNEPVGEARLDGSSILSEATVPDQDVISLMFGDD